MHTEKCVMMFFFRFSRLLNVPSSDARWKYRCLHHNENDFNIVMRVLTPAARSRVVCVCVVREKWEEKLALKSSNNMFVCCVFIRILIRKSHSIMQRFLSLLPSLSFSFSSICTKLLKKLIRSVNFVVSYYSALIAKWELDCI